MTPRFGSCRWCKGLNCRELRGTWELYSTEVVAVPVLQAGCAPGAEVGVPSAGCHHVLLQAVVFALTEQGFNALNSGADFKLSYIALLSRSLL